MHILVVDDEKLIRDVIKEYLINEGYTVLEASNGIDAIEMVKIHKNIDLIVMDIMMPKMDGFSAVKEIKKTVKATKTSTNVKKKKTTKFPWSKKLNMANVDKITYTSSKKSVVTVNKNGKITAKKKGTAKVKAVVTLKDGTKKTVTMKVKVK